MNLTQRIADIISRLPIAKNLLFAFILLAPMLGMAQMVRDSTTLTTATDTTVAVAAVDNDAPVAVPPASDKALRHSHTGNIIWVFTTIWGFILPLIFLLTGFSARMRNWAAKVSQVKFLLIGVYLIIYLVVMFIIGLPIDYYTDFVRPHNYGLSDQAFSKWITDALIGLGVGIFGAVFLINLLYWVLRKSPKRWWLYFGLMFIPISFLLQVIVPVFVEPLFNKFGPMQDKTLETKILAQAARAGIEGGRVYEVNKSVDTKTLNAYVNGLGSTKRIVLWDNTIKKMDEKELLFVLGHEMGHFALNHALKFVFISSALVMLLLFLAWVTGTWFIKMFGSRIGFTELSDIASFPLIVLLASVYGFILSPVTNSISRHFEHEADIFGLEITQNNHAAATAFIKLQTENLSNPKPSAIIRFFRADHPPLGERIEFANTYKPWKTGEKLQFGDCFKADSIK